MKKLAIFVLFLAAASILPFLLTAGAGAAPLTGPGPRPAPAYRVTGPYNNENLTVFLIHGQDTVKSQNILTLEEAMAQKKVVVHETSNVNELAVENNSNEIVFIQSGDIVKGGRQDRTMQYDMLIPPKSGIVKVPAFCVEHGRWSQRGSESTAAFSGATNGTIGRELKIAAKNAGLHSAVWAQVAAQQQKLQTRIGRTVAASAAPTSLNATIDHQAVAQASNTHLRKLTNIVDGQRDVIGYAFAINGKINSADTYASNALFVKLWPKLLKSSAIEAVGDQEKGRSFATPSHHDVLQLISREDKSPAKPKVVSKDSSMFEQERAGYYSYKTRWNSAPGRFQTVDEAPVLHSNWIAK